MTSWKNQHTQWVLRQMTQNFLNNLMTTWKTLTHPHLICMNQQVAIFKKHVSFCLLSRVPEAISCCWHLCWAQPASDRKPAPARGKGKKKGKDFFAQRWKVSKPWNNWSLAKTTHLTCRVSSTDCQKKRPTETSTIRGGPHHAPRLRPDQCMLCRQVGHRASECLHKEKATSRSPGKRAFGTHALGCAVFGAMCYGATVDDTEEEQDANDIENFIAFSIESLEGFATPVGGAHEGCFWIHECGVLALMSPPAEQPPHVYHRHGTGLSPLARTYSRTWACPERLLVLAYCFLCLGRSH